MKLSRWVIFYLAELKYAYQQPGDQSRGDYFWDITNIHAFTHDLFRQLRDFLHTHQ